MATEEAVVLVEAAVAAELQGLAALGDLGRAMAVLAAEWRAAAAQDSEERGLSTRAAS